MTRIECFKFHPPGTKFSKEEGWKFAPLNMIYDVKKEDFRYKERLVVGGHVTDETEYMTYPLTVQSIYLRICW